VPDVAAAAELALQRTASSVARTALFAGALAGCPPRRAGTTAVSRPVSAAPARWQQKRYRPAAVAGGPGLAPACLPPDGRAGPAGSLAPARYACLRSLQRTGQCGGWCGVAARLPPLLAGLPGTLSSCRGRAPAYTPPGARGTPPPRKVQGLFPARPRARSRAAEPVKAEPCGWRAKSARASLDRTCRAPPAGDCLARKMPPAQASQTTAGRAPVALPLVAARLPTSAAASGRRALLAAWRHVRPRCWHTPLPRLAGGAGRRHRGGLARAATPAQSGCALGGG